MQSDVAKHYIQTTCLSSVSNLYDRLKRLTRKRGSRTWSITKLITIPAMLNCQFLIVFIYNEVFSNLTCRVAFGKALSIRSLLISVACLPFDIGQKICKFPTSSYSTFPEGRVYIIVDIYTVVIARKLRSCVILIAS